MSEPLFPAQTDSAADTTALGRAFGATLQPGAVVALYGDLGAGKTHFVKGVAAARGVADGENLANLLRPTSGLPDDSQRRVQRRVAAIRSPSSSYTLKR